MIVDYSPLCDNLFQIQWATMSGFVIFKIGQNDGPWNRYLPLKFKKWQFLVSIRSISGVLTAKLRFSRREIVAKTVLLDPVALLLAQPDVAYNFLYRHATLDFVVC